MAALLALLSSAMWGSADYLAGRLSRVHGALRVLAASQVVALVGMVVVATVTAAWRSPTGYVGWAVLAGLAGASGLGLFYRALSVGTMGVVSPIASLSVVVPLAVGIADGERPTGVQALGIVLAIVGVVAASGPEVRGEAGWQPVALAGGAALLLGVTLVGIARGSADSVVMTMTVMRMVSSGVLLLVLLVGGARVRGRGGQLAWVALVGVLDVGANLAFGVASTRGLLSLVAVFGSLYPVATILLARQLDGERLRPVQAAGVAMALAGAAAISAG